MVQKRSFASDQRIVVCGNIPVTGRPKGLYMLVGYHDVVFLSSVSSVKCETVVIESGAESGFDSPIETETYS